MISFTDVYCPQDEFRIISQIYRIAKDGIFFIFYKKYFDSLQNNFNSKPDEAWYVNTITSYYDSAVLQWCLIFGSYKEPTHYSNLLNYPGIKRKLENLTGYSELCRHTFKDYFLKEAKIEFEEYKKFHKETKKYRDMYLIHREHHSSVVNYGDIISPKLDNCRVTLDTVFILILKLLKKYPKEPDQLNTYLFQHEDLVSVQQLEDSMKRDYLPLSFIR